MRKSRFTESQIVQILAEYNSGASMEELARRNGFHANTIRLWRTNRVYRLAGLQMGRRQRRGRAKVVRGRSLRRATRPFEGWTLDFIHNRLFNGRAFPSKSVIDVLDEVARTYGYPKYLRIDNVTELTSKIMQLWSEEHCVERGGSGFLDSDSSFISG